MSIEANSLQNQIEPSEIKSQEKVDINILLNRVRHEKKRERKENLLFLGLISLYRTSPNSIAFFAWPGSPSFDILL